MKTKTLFLVAMLTAIAVVSVEARPPQYTTNTLSFSGASWSDGGSLDGYFTIEYDNGTPYAVLSLDVTTGNGTSDGFIGYDYIYNVSGQANTIYAPGFSALQNEGAPANELEVGSSFVASNQSYDAPANEPVALGSPDSNYILFLDWQGSNPTSLYVGDVGFQYSSEDYDGSPGIRSLNDEGGSVPEPTSMALAGLGFIILHVVKRRNFADCCCFAGTRQIWNKL
jgi:hypothetical protein